MRAYQNIKFALAPDIADIQADGRKSSAGRIRRDESFNYYGGRFNEVAKVCHNDRGYNRPVKKAATRRMLKRADRALEARFQARAEGSI